MAKPKIVFACQSCGYQSPKWLGRCPDCNQWNTFAEEKFEKATTPRGALSLGSKEDPAPIHEINRVLSGIGEIDRAGGALWVHGRGVGLHPFDNAQGRHKLRHQVPDGT